MGGPGSGGHRTGSGRKRKTAEERRLTGNAGHRGRVLTLPNAALPAVLPAVAVEEFDAPDELTTDERNVWLRLAPHAFANGTLSKATELAFCLLCRNIVLERRYAVSVQDAGSANHRGMIQRIDAELLRFNLSPCGKPLIEEPTDKPASNPMQEKYFGRGRHGA